MDLLFRNMTPFVVLVFLTVACAPGQTSHTYNINRPAQEGVQEKESNLMPKNTEDYPSGYWFGTQSLLCVMGMTGSPSSSGRKRRDVTSPSRYPLRFSHRLLFYKGSMYEWGTGTLGYFIGEAPSVVECEVTWEEEPTGNSTCHPDAIKEFTYEYRSTYGVYNIATNNCHNFANHVSQLLSSPDCSARPTGWSRVARHFWRYLGHLLEGNTGHEVKLDDINDHEDRTTIN